MPDTMLLNLPPSSPVFPTIYAHESFFGPEHTWLSHYLLCCCCVFPLSSISRLGRRHTLASYYYLNFTNETATYLGAELLDGLCASWRPQFKAFSVAEIKDSSNIASFDTLNNSILFIDSSTKRLLMRSVRFNASGGADVSPSSIVGNENVTLLSCNPQVAFYCVVYSDARLCKLKLNGTSGSLSQCLSISPNATRIQLLSSRHIAVYYSDSIGLYKHVDAITMLATYPKGDIYDMAEVSKNEYVACSNAGVYIVAEAALAQGLLSSTLKYQGRCNAVVAWNSTIAVYSDPEGNTVSGRKFLTELWRNDSESSQTWKVMREYSVSPTVPSFGNVTTHMVMDEGYVYLLLGGENVLVLKHSHPPQLDIDFYLEASQGKSLTLLSGPGSRHSLNSGSRLVLWQDSGFRLYSEYKIVWGILQCFFNKLPAFPDIVLELSITGLAASCPAKAKGYNYATVCAYRRNLRVTRKTPKPTYATDVLIIVFFSIILFFFVGTAIVLTCMERAKLQRAEQVRQPIPFIHVNVNESDHSALSLDLRDPQPD